jgi:hypothetical protein
MHICFEFHLIVLPPFFFTFGAGAWIHRLINTREAVGN